MYHSKAAFTYINAVYCEGQGELEHEVDLVDGWVCPVDDDLKPLLVVLHHFLQTERLSKDSIAYV